MPRCQRTFRLLPEPMNAERWVCPFCPDSEVYAKVTSSVLLEYALLAEAALIADFGPPRNRKSTRLYWGLSPECVHDRGRCAIYLQTGSDDAQARLQLGHELFHRVCSEGRVFHFTHEMLACLVSVQLLRQFGYVTYADQMDEAYTQNAPLCSLELFKTVDVARPSYPPGFYARAYLTAKQVEQAAGWSSLVRLARCLDTTDTPDVTRWLAGLPPEVATNVQRVCELQVN